MQNALNMQSYKNIYTLGAAVNIDAYSQLFDFKNANNIRFPLSIFSDMGKNHTMFSKQVVFIGKKGQIIGMLENADDEHQINLMLKRTLASFDDIYLKPYDDQIRIKNDPVTIGLYDIFYYKNLDGKDFQISIHPDPLIANLSLDGEYLTILPGSYSGHTEFEIKIGVKDKDAYVTKKIILIGNDSENAEDFEYEIFTDSEINWISGGHEFWEITGEEAFSGRKSLRSGRIGHDGRSSISLTTELNEPGTLTFAYRTSTYYVYYMGVPDGDFLNFYIDGINMTDHEKDLWGGDNDWRIVSYELNAGVRELKWEYEKNDWGTDDVDAVWLDYILIPGTISGPEIRHNNAKIPEISSGIYPNPFNPDTRISFDLTERGNMKISVFDSKGSLVKKVAEGNFQPGSHSFNFNGAELSSGIYYVVFESSYKTETSKILLLK